LNPGTSPVASNRSTREVGPDAVADGVDVDGAGLDGLDPGADEESAVRAAVGALLFAPHPEAVRRQASTATGSVVGRGRARMGPP
jgi:hypothetical protein